MWQFSWKSEKKFFDPVFKTFLTYRGKNKDEDKKYWENKFNFWILPIKIRLNSNFHKDLWKKFFDTFVGYFWLIKAKIKLKMKKYGKMSSVFEFSMSKLEYVAIFMKILDKIFDPFFKTFLPNWGKNEDEDEKVRKNEFNFWVLHTKIKLCDNFHKNWRRKKLLTHFLYFWLIEAINDEKFGKISSIFEFSIPKLGYKEVFPKILRKKVFFRIFSWRHTKVFKG